jgi:predicted negative regulator of RcsB-dependent stress response
MKRKQRKHLKEDQFVSTVNKIVNFTKRRYRELLAVGVAVLFLILVFIGIKIIRAQNVKKDSQILAQILEVSEELKDDPEKLAELEKLAGNEKFSRLAYIKLAAYWNEQGDTQKAQAYLEKIPSRKKDVFYYQAQDMLAQIYMQDKEFDKAIHILQEIEEENPESYTLDTVLFHKAQAHEEKGEITVALDIYRKIQDEYPQTFYGMDASQKVKELEEKR